ncbi:RNA polymerase sigma factor, sigma-70 family [Verrucomicrobiia bacterium DG1235]|nr:RNA polymerase sigma factor, sigma-70 family [Verrucomicrobiae bacterium DG1235]
MRKIGANDHELMRGLIREDPGSLESIIEKWERPLYSFAYRYTQNEFATREIVQETFVRVFTKRERYNFDYPLSSWIFTIAANLCKNKARWHKRHPEVSLEASLGNGGEEGERSMMDVISSEGELPAESIEKLEELDMLKQAVMGLPHDLRTAVLLHHYEDLSYKEIAEVVGCSVRGVETRLYRARKLLRVRISQIAEREEEAQKKTAPFSSEAVHRVFSNAVC